MARGDGREYRVMLFSGLEARAQPVIVTIHPAAQWSEIRLKLSGFPGADLAHLRALAVCAGAPAGAFQLDIDQVEIR